MPSGMAEAIPVRNDGSYEGTADDTRGIEGTAFGYETLDSDDERRFHSRERGPVNSYAPMEGGSEYSLAAKSKSTSTVASPFSKQGESAL